MGKGRFAFPVVVAVVFSCCAWGQDWEQWGGTINRNMVCQERGLVGLFEPDKDKALAGEARNVKWIMRLGSHAYGNPTVSKGRVFVGTNALKLSDDPRFKTTRGGAVRCFDERSGGLIWQLRVPERKSLPKDGYMNQQHLGICSSPTVDGDYVYVVTNGGEILCLDVDGQDDGNDGPFVDEGKYMVDEGKESVEIGPIDGDIVWVYDPIEELGVCPHDVASCSVLIVGDMLYVGTSNGVEKSHEIVVSPDAPSLIVLDKRTGKLVGMDDEKLGHRLWHAQWSSPSAGVVGDKTLIFLGGGDGVCYAFEALKEAGNEPVALKKVWWYDCNPPEYRFEDGKPIPYYRGDMRKKESPNENDGKYLGPSQIIATPVFCEGRIYVSIGQDPAHGRGVGLMHCIDATQTGDVTKSGCVWMYRDIERSMATAGVADGLVYVNDISGKLHCLDAQTGEKVWIYDAQKETWGGPLVADGKLYFGNTKEFCILEAGRELRVLGTIRLGAPIYSTPIAANGTLYVATSQYLWAASAE